MVIRDRLERGDILYDLDLMPGARNAVTTCLGLKRGERLTMVTDVATAEIAASLLTVARQIGAIVECFVLEEEGKRPLDRCPPRILGAAIESDAIICCIQPQEGEIRSRGELIDLVERQRIRYAHMVWITPTIMRQAMRADYQAVDRLSNWVLDRVRGAERVVVRSPAGTDIEATFRRDHLWIKTSGLISPMYWSNLPGGEVWSVPDDVKGVFVVDGTIGDYLCRKYREISATPLVLEIEDGVLRAAHCKNAALQREFFDYCHAETNSDRVGEFAFGTNIAIAQMIGNLLQDEKIPGVHIAFGNPLPSLTGATWACATHIDAISRSTDVWANGTQIMGNGHYLTEAETPLSTAG
ncbi:MAG: aminopeptidase [Chloroflexota bacterium]|nr:MAG: aminopeptidase [Chloroflexota bacterium]